MNINAFYNDSEVDAARSISVARTFAVSGALLHLNKQYNDIWHLIHGKELMAVPHLWESVTIKREEGDRNLADVCFSGRGFTKRCRGIIVMKEADHPYIQFEMDLAGVVTVYCTKNFMQGRVPTRLEIEL